MKSSNLLPGLWIDDKDFIRINNINDKQPVRKCWICLDPNTNGTCFCEKHFAEWESQWNGREARIDICQFSYAHREYRGARLPGHGSKQIVRDWLGC